MLNIFVNIFVILVEGSQKLQSVGSVQNFAYAPTILNLLIDQIFWKSKDLIN